MKRNQLPSFSKPAKPRKREKIQRGSYIQLVEGDGSYGWVFYVRYVARVTNATGFPTLSHASQSAYSFRSMLVQGDELEIRSPEGYKYSGE